MVCTKLTCPGGGYNDSSEDIITVGYMESFSTGSFKLSPLTPRPTFINLILSVSLRRRSSSVQPPNWWLHSLLSIDRWVMTLVKMCLMSSCFVGPTNGTLNCRQTNDKSYLFPSSNCAFVYHPVVCCQPCLGICLRGSNNYFKLKTKWSIIKRISFRLPWPEAE